MSEEVVKGFVFEAQNLDEEKDLIKYVGGIGEIKKVELEVACQSVLGKVGKMETIRARIFVPEGDGDTLVGSMKSFRNGHGMLARDELDLVVKNARRVKFQDDFEDDFEDDDFTEGDFSETGSMADVDIDEHATPRISPSISTLNDADIPHQYLDELPSATIDEYLMPQVHEHPFNPSTKTMDWAATTEVQTTETVGIEDTKVYEALMEVEEPNKIGKPHEAAKSDTMHAKDIAETKVDQQLMQTEELGQADVVPESQGTDVNPLITETVEMPWGTETYTYEMRKVEYIDGRPWDSTQDEPGHNYWLRRASRSPRGQSFNTLLAETGQSVNPPIASTVTAGDEEEPEHEEEPELEEKTAEEENAADEGDAAHGEETTRGEEAAPASGTQPWSPTTPWRKEHASAPVRPVLEARTPSQSSGTTPRMRKTSDSIKSLVEKFENMSPQNKSRKGA
jgi:hypothetical protein